MHRTNGSRKPHKLRQCNARLRLPGSSLDYICSRRCGHTTAKDPGQKRHFDSYFQFGWD
jgi:hypothetical protein